MARHPIMNKSRHKRLEIRARSFDKSQDNVRITNLLSADQQNLIQGASTLVQFDHGEHPIFLESEGAPFVYVVTKGIVRISRLGISGRRQVIAFHLPGGVFGFPEFGRYVNSATAVGEVSLYRVAWPRLKELMRLDPQLQGNFLVRMAFDLRQAENRILILGQQNVSQRLASFLLELMDHPDFYKAQLRHLTLPLSRYDLGDYLGTSPETVVRVMTKMEEEGLLCRLSSRLLHIPSAQRLSDMLRAKRRND